MREDGKIDYVEMPGVDMDALKGFYQAAFGWRFTDYGPTYTAFENSGVEGGFQGDASEGSTQPLIILYADDLEAMEFLLDKIMSVKSNKQFLDSMSS